MSQKRRARRLLGLVAFVLVLVAVASPIASAACDINIGSQFSKSNPLINVTANTSLTPAGVAVGGLGWSWNGVKTNLGGGYYRTQWIYPPVNPYVVGHLYSVYVTFNGGNCNGRIGVGNIKAVS